MKCPDGCAGETIRDLTEGELELLRAHDPKLADDPWDFCRYCKLVFRTGYRGTTPHPIRIGTIDSELRGPGFVPF